MADILIRGIDIPACGFYGWVEFSGDGKFRILDVREDVAEEHEYIALQPHGRLIDADEATRLGWLITRTRSSGNANVSEIKTMNSGALPIIIPASEEGE